MVDSIEQRAFSFLEATAAMVEKREAFKRGEARSQAELPLFEPGSTHEYDDASRGFRVADGYALSFSSDRRVRVSASRSGKFTDKISAILWRHSDGGLSWMYWDYGLRSGDGSNLAQCALAHGVGGWHDQGRDLRAKVVFLDEGRSMQAGRCFTIMMDRPSTGEQVRHLQNERSDSVVLVFRSAVPEEVQRAISARDVVNARQGLQCATWWFM